MPTKKKTSNTTKKRKSKVEKDIETIENNLEKIEREKQRKDIIEEKKKAIKEDLQNQLAAQGKFGKHFDDMVEDYLYLVELKEDLKDDIKVNGIRYKTTGGNGFTTYKANESCERLLKTNAEMLKILQELELKSPDKDPSGDDENDLL